jgi:hypothetical protein
MPVGGAPAGFGAAHRDGPRHGGAVAGFFGGQRRRRERSPAAGPIAMAAEQGIERICRE